MQNQNTARFLIAALGFLLTASLSTASGSKTEPGKLTLDEEKAKRRSRPIEAGRAFEQILWVGRQQSLTEYDAAYLDWLFAPAFRSPS
jgi:hypothetical protein